MANQQVLTFVMKAVDESKDALSHVERGLDDVKDSAEKAAKEVGEVGSKLYDTAEAGGNAEQALRGSSDIMVFMGEQFGIQLGPMQQWSAALADVGGGVEAILKGGPAFIAQMGAWATATWAQVTALYAQATAFIVANAPIIAIIAGIALLAAGIVLLITHWDTITEKVPILGQAFDAAKTVVLDVKDKVVGAFQAVVDFLRDHWPKIAVLISGPFAPIVLLATDAFGVRSALVGAAQGMIDKFEDFMKFIEGLPGRATTAATALGSAIIEGLKSGIGAVGGIAADIASAVGGAIKNFVNSEVIDKINSALEFEFGFSVAGKGFSVHINPPDIPHLAMGGIVTRPTLALIGEAGPEAVVPLSGPNAPRGMGTTIIINALDARSFQQWLAGNPAAVDHLAHELQRRAVA